MAGTVTQAKGMTAAAKAAAKAKREQTRPWVELRGAWYEAIALQRGVDVVSLLKGQVGGPVTWGAPEIKLAKLLLKEVELPQAIELVRHYIGTWCPRHGKHPSFGLFWAVRGQLHDEVRGVAPVRQRAAEVVKGGEFDEDVAKKSPDFGWG